MIQPRPDIWLGDAVRALHVLDPDEETALAVLELLGLRERPAIDTGQAVPAVGPPPDVRSPPRQPSRRSPRPDEQSTVIDTPASRYPSAEDQGHRRPIVETLPVAASRPPAELPALADVLPAPAPAIRMPSSDLLDPIRQRAILGGICGSPAPTGELNVPEIVRRIVSGRPLTTLPHLVRPTTRRGLQLLVDIAPAMLPFSRDQTDVRRAIELIAGPDGLEVVAFRGHPLGPAGAGAGPVWTWSRYQPPTGRLPIVALTDLGVHGPAAERIEIQTGWRKLARLTREAGCPLVVLTPVPSRRIPPDLRMALDLVVWDRATTVRDAVTAARRAAGRSTRLADRA